MTLKELAIIGYMSGVILLSPLILLVPFFLEYGRSIIRFPSYGLGDFIFYPCILIAIPSLSIGFYMVTMRFKRNAIALATLLGFAFNIAILFLQKLLEGELAYFLTNSLEFFVGLIIIALLIGFIEYGIWSFSFEIYWKFVKLLKNSQHNTPDYIAKN